MYRSRLKGSLNRDVLRYLSSMSDDLSLLYYDIIGSEAHTIMLYEQNIISKEEAKAILSALEELKGKEVEGEGYEDIHEAIEAYVVKKAGIDSGGKMHTARSRNDQVALDIRMKVRDDINEIFTLIIDLIDSLLSRAEENTDVPMLMYTHLQHAQIGTFSHYLLSYTDMLLRDLERLDSCYNRVNRSPLGASAIGGTSLNIDRNRVAALLGFDSLIENSIDATSSRDFMIEFSFDLASIMLNLSRIAEDLVLWSSSEFNYVELPDELSSTSSVMPQKKNPCPLELLRARASMTIGILTGLMATVKSLPSGYSRDLQDTKRMLFQAIEICKDSLVIMRAVIEGMNVKKEVMLESASKSYALALDIAEALVKRGVAFRKAHKIVGAIVKRASEEGKRISSLGRDEIASCTDFDPDLLYKIIQSIDPVRSIESRVSLGSPNPKEQLRIIQSRRKISAEFKELVERRVKRIRERFKEIEKISNSF